MAVSVGSVFFGANTYIGNGPNFMVKAIADHQKVHTPTFVAYVLKYTLPFMVPMLLAVWLLFFSVSGGAVRRFNNILTLGNDILIKRARAQVPY